MADQDSKVVELLQEIRDVERERRDDMRSFYRLYRRMSWPFYYLCLLCAIVLTAMLGWAIWAVVTSP